MAFLKYVRDEFVALLEKEVGLVDAETISVASITPVGQGAIVVFAVTHSGLVDNYLAYVKEEGIAWSKPVD